MKKPIQSFLFTSMVAALFSSSSFAMEAPIVYDPSPKDHSHRHQPRHYSSRYSPTERRLAIVSHNEATRREQTNNIQVFKEAIHHYLEDRIAHSLDKHQSLSWLFRKDFREHSLNPLRLSLHHAIDTLGGSFFERLLTIKDNIPVTDPGYLTLDKFLTAHHFMDLTNHSVASHALLPIYFHPTGLMIRIKPNSMQLSLSMYHRDALQELIASIESNDTRKIADVFARKSHNEACKIYLGYSQLSSRGDRKLVVEPVPHSPFAIIGKNSVFEQSKFQNLKEFLKYISPRDHRYLEEFWIQKVMELGHLQMTRTRREDVIEQSWLSVPVVQEPGQSSSSDLSEEWLRNIANIPPAPEGETVEWYHYQTTTNPTEQEFLNFISRS